MSGYLKSYRKMLDNPLFQGRADWLGAWVWLFHRACWKPIKFNMAGKIVTIERGQLVTSLSRLEAAWGMSRKKVRLILARFEMGTMIVTARGTAGTIITVCNYDLYQDEEVERDTPEDTARGTPRAHQGHTKEEGKKVNKREVKRDTNVSPKKSPASVLSTLLGSELAAAVVEHRQRLRKPMTVKAAELMLREFEKCTEPIAGAEMMIERGWQGFKAEWFRNDANRQRTNGNDEFDQLMRLADDTDRLAAGEREVDDGAGLQPDVPLLARRHAG